MNFSMTQNFVERFWDNSVMPTLMEFVRVPCKSPLFDSRWKENGFLLKASNLVANWTKKHLPSDAQIEVIELEGKTPVLYVELPGSSDDTVLFYGHLDKQPEGEGWSKGLSPFEPVVRDGKLYGRGSADDGYAPFAAVTAALALKEQSLKHARIVMLFECCEESGSQDLPFYIEHLKNRIKSPRLIFCLDSGCANYNQLWATTSLRGMISGEISIEVLSEGMHSGSASGIVPSSFRILRLLLDRIEDASTGELLLPELRSTIPEIRAKQAELAAEVLGESIYRELPFVGNTRPTTNDLGELILNHTWRPTLCVTGMDGIPAISNAGNVLRPKTSAKISIRTPPTCDVEKAQKALTKVLESNPPYGAKISFKAEENGWGFDAPKESLWLSRSLEESSREFFAKPLMCIGEGGSIPLMGLLSEKFPRAQFVITGVLGPNANAHGPNEFLHLDMVKKVTACVANVLSAHHQSSS